MAEREFVTEVVTDGRGRAYIIVPFDPSTEWGRKRRHYVRGEINGVPFDGSLGSRGGQYFMPINKEIRRSAGVEPGDTVTIRLDAGEARKAEVPAELAEMLKTDAKAAAFFSGLSDFYRNQYAQWVASAKEADTRARRARQAVDLLRRGHKQR